MSVSPPDPREPFTRARFPVRLESGPGDPDLLDQATKALGREYRDSIRPKLLHCWSLRQVAELEAGTLFELTVGHTIEFDWTWEGSTARAYEAPNHWDTQPSSLSPTDSDDGSERWMGELVEVDEAAGLLFVVVANPESPPTRGPFWVRPFEFLASLHEFYSKDDSPALHISLSRRLALSAGQPTIDASIDDRRMDQEQAGFPTSPWGILWGPPGTGKTHAIGEELSKHPPGARERVLVISTTNKATDTVALSIGRGLLARQPGLLERRQVARIGKGASLSEFQAAGLESLLHDTETSVLGEIEQLAAELRRTPAADQRARLRQQIRALRLALRDAARERFLDPRTKIVVATAFRAATFLKDGEIRTDLEAGVAPFTTLIVDEAGLISRIALAGLSHFASRRVVLAGDSRQLAPISRVSRILPSEQMRWLSRSGLSHLGMESVGSSGITLLREQHRMHPDIGQLVSRYQYEGRLTHAPGTTNRGFSLPPVWGDAPRAVWCVLDEETTEVERIRADRGPGHRSWIREITITVLDRLFADSEFARASGMFLSPFRAQAQVVADYFANRRLHSWRASTVHSQQGAEADIVLFDTVNAGSYAWAHDDWKRLLNVGISRAREAVMLLCSRAEMEEPYLAPLRSDLAPCALGKSGRSYRLRMIVEAEANPVVAETSGSVGVSLGLQLLQRRALRPVLSSEQERLCRLELDGKPRLVRGVAGSGKTVVMAHWVVQTLNRRILADEHRVWIVFGNRALQGLIEQTLLYAWSKQRGIADFPWGRLNLWHIQDLLQSLQSDLRASATGGEFDYENMASSCLERMAVVGIEPRCDAIFLDEAQDFGPTSLQLLHRLVRRSSEDSDQSRSVNIFYDNAQNIYARGTPRWTDLGLDLRGRSSVMKESFRSTRPIAEFALNVLYRLEPQAQGPDHRELVSRGLLEEASYDRRTWWRVRFNQIGGPAPILRQFASPTEEMSAIASQCLHLVENEHVLPADIVIIYNGKESRTGLETIVAPMLESRGIELSIQQSRKFRRGPRTLIATTAHSFKGYDAEIVLLAGATGFVTHAGAILASALYVAMTRARSLLEVYAHRRPTEVHRRLLQTLEACLEDLERSPTTPTSECGEDDLADLSGLIPAPHRDWFHSLTRAYRLRKDPITAPSGEIVADPLFWFEGKEGTYACYGSDTPSARVLQNLEEHGVRLLRLGDVRKSG